MWSCDWALSFLFNNSLWKWVYSTMRVTTSPLVIILDHFLLLSFPISLSSSLLFLHPLANSRWCLDPDSAVRCHYVDTLPPNLSSLMSWQLVATIHCWWGLVFFLFVLVEEQSLMHICVWRSICSDALYFCFHTRAVKYTILVCNLKEQSEGISLICRIN